MSIFVDETQLEVRSGDGGVGAVSFRREKYAARGGPDGGDGGKGGDVIFITRRNLNTLSHLRAQHLLKAQHGMPGRGRRMHGANGSDLVIPVPPGTCIRAFGTGEKLHDFSIVSEGESWICLQGGKGGLGNWHFRSPRNQAPAYSQDGKPGQNQHIVLELSLIADIGLVGMPSSGKSSLINALTASNSKVGAYPFTTKTPQLGVLRHGGIEVVLADIPGLIEGASGGAGLGFKFLKHVSRAGSLAFLVDLGEENPLATIKTLEEELDCYDPNFCKKERIIVGSKTDLDESGRRLISLQSAFPDECVIGISVYARKGLRELRELFIERGSRMR